MRALRLSSHLVPPLVLLGIVWLVFGLRDPVFATKGNLYAVLTAWAPFCLVAVGEGFTILMGEGDLSVGSVAALAGVMAVSLAGLGLVEAIIITTVALTIFGAAQGYVIDKLKINSLVLTIGTLIGISGAAYIAARNTTVALPLSQINESNSITQQMWDIFSPMSLIAIGISVVAWVFLTFTRPGREIYALGGGRREALAAGVATRSRFVLAFACSAGAAALAGALISTSSGGADPVGVRNLLLSTITAVLVGGVSLTGGIGSVVGICVGAFTIQSIIAGVAIEGANSNVSDLLIAGLLVCVLVFDAAFRWLPRRRAGKVMTVDEALVVGEG
jgi:ribose/xylose/arabinose/galactoside ABC-type transport system permease subunit